AYASSWMKCRHPDVFCAALLNAQPMGFYAPAQIVRDARQHGVEVRPVCINASHWDCTLEPVRSPDGAKRNQGSPPQHGTDSPAPARGAPDYASLHPGYGPGLRAEVPGPAAFAVRLGLRMVKELSQTDADTIIAARADQPFVAIGDLWRRAAVPAAALV